jgi:hypothetical protein
LSIDDKVWEKHEPIHKSEMREENTMSRNFFCSLIMVTMGLSLMLSAGNASAQQQPQYPPPQSQYPPQQPGYPQQQPQYPPSQPQYPSHQPQYSSPMPSQTFNDALGRFKVNLPQGSMPMGSTYNFGIPAAMAQVSITTVAMDQMFQMQMQNFPNMLRQMGANIDKEQPLEVKGRPARFVAATMKDQASGGRCTR